MEIPNREVGRISSKRPNAHQLILSEPTINRTSEQEYTQAMKINGKKIQKILLRTFLHRATTLWHSKGTPITSTEQKNLMNTQKEKKNDTKSA